MGLPEKILDYGTAFLHVSPESYAGGNLALVQNGDIIEVDVKNKRLHLDVPDEELEKKMWNRPIPGADLDFPGWKIRKHGKTRIPLTNRQKQLFQSSVFLTHNAL